MSKAKPQQPDNFDLFENMPDNTKDGVTGVTGVTTSNGAASKVTPSKNQGVTGVTSLIKKVDLQAEPTAPEVVEAKIQRPCFMTHDDWFLLNGKRYKAGLYWHGEKEGADDAPPEPINERICSPIYIKAISSDSQDQEFGKLLCFINLNGKWKDWVMPTRLLKSAGDELRGELLDQGWMPESNRAQTRARFTEWLLQENPSERITAATSTGWHDDGKAFVFPTHTLGNEKIRFQSEYTRNDFFVERSTLAEWKETVASQCVGNPMLTLALSVAFAGTLLLPAKLQSSGGAGINLMGRSSQGKTTALEVAASVWGASEYVRTWNATGNGSEAIAASLNDALLILDELGQSDPKNVGDVVYMLANGSGKTRAKSSGGARRTQAWRLMVLSSGEKTLPSHMAEVGIVAKAGQEARLLDIPATEQTYGVFDELHGCKDGREFADKLKTATSKAYGTAGKAFIKGVMQKDDLPALYNEIKEQAGFTATDGVEARAAATFALIALAGELATNLGITGWDAGEAMDSAVIGFELWRGARGQGSTEDRHILESIQSYIETYNDSQFTNLDNASDLVKTAKRSGYWKNTPDGQRIYYFTTAGLKDAVKGYEVRTANQALRNAGWLAEVGKDNKTAIAMKINNTTTRLTAVLPKELT